MTNIGMAMLVAVTERKSFCMGKMDVVLSVGDNSWCEKIGASDIHNDILIQLRIELRAIKKRPVKFTGRFFIYVTAHAEIDGCLEMLKSGVEGMIMKWIGYQSWYFETHPSVCYLEFKLFVRDTA